MDKKLYEPSGQPASYSPKRIVENLPTRSKGSPTYKPVPENDTSLRLAEVRKEILNQGMQDVTSEYYESLFHYVENSGASNNHKYQTISTELDSF